MNLTLMPNQGYMIESVNTLALLVYVKNAGAYTTLSEFPMYTEREGLHLGFPESRKPREEERKKQG